MKKQTHQMLNHCHKIFPNKTQTTFINDDIFAYNCDCGFSLARDWN